MKKNNLNVRLVAKLEIKSENLVKPIYFEGLKKIGDPEKFALKYYQEGIDEIIYLDIVASLYQREINYNLIKKTSKGILVPMTVGGGVRSLKDMEKLFDAGADKVAINTYALQHDPNIIDQAAKVFGSQAVVLNIEAKKRVNWWECFSDNGRIPSGRNLLNWIKEASERGVGEILLQSIDKDGSRKGFDTDLISQINDVSTVPVIFASGAGSEKDIINLNNKFNPSGIALASVLHFKTLSLNKLKAQLNEKE